MEKKGLPSNFNFFEYKDKIGQSTKVSFRQMRKAK